jgi:hypothetical protein
MLNPLLAWKNSIPSVVSPLTAPLSTLQGDGLIVVERKTADRHGRGGSRNSLCPATRRILDARSSRARPFPFTAKSAKALQCALARPGGMGLVSLCLEARQVALVDLDRAGHHPPSRSAYPPHPTETMNAEQSTTASHHNSHAKTQRRKEDRRIMAPRKNP